MADVNKQTKNDNDIIIRDQDGTYKILREGKFVPLDDAKSASTVASTSDTGPKRAPDAMPKPPAPKPVTAWPSSSEVMASKPTPATAPKSPAMPIQPPVRGMADQELMSQADTFITKSGVTFASGEIRSRVAKALVAHIKQVRKPFETRESLLKPIADGGAGLSAQEVENIMKAAGDTSATAPKPSVQPVTRPQNPIVKPTPSGKVPVGKEIGAPASVALNTMVAGDAPYFKVTPEQAKQAFSLPSVSAPRPAMADVQKPMRAIGGPVDELAYDLVTWRRMAPNPQDRIKKTEAQLDLLEQDGYTQRLRGILSWRSSDVMRLYLLAAKQSLEDGKPLPQMLSVGGSGQLSWDEWQAVAELNERLMTV